MITFQVDIEQDEPDGYGEAMREENEVRYKLVKAKMGKEIENLGVLPYYVLENMLGADGIDALKKLIIPGLVRKRILFCKRKRSHQSRSFRLSTSFLKRWELLIGEKNTKKAADEYLKSLGALGQLSQYTTNIYTSWGAKKGNAISLETNNVNLIPLFVERTKKIKSSIFMENIANLAFNDKRFTDISTGFTVNFAGEVPFELVKFSRLDYFFLKTGGEIPDIIQKIKRNLPESYKRLEETTRRVKSRRIYFKRQQKRKNRSNRGRGVFRSYQSDTK